MDIELLRAYDTVVNTYRLTDAAGGGSWEGFAVHLTGVNCLIQAIDDAPVEDLDGSVGKNYLMFCDVLDIKEGDEVIDGSDTYKVVGVKILYAFGCEHHMELIIRKYYV